MTVWRLGDQTPPPAKRITDTVIERLEHQYELAPGPLQTTPAQDMRLWDPRRIFNARWDHLDWMHDHFADEVLLAGMESETMPEEHAMPSEHEAGPRPVPGDDRQGDMETPAVDPPDVRG